jgi:signal transduction histidine kinase
MNPAAQKMFRLSPDHGTLPLAGRIALLRAETPDGHPVPPDRFPAARALQGETVLSEIIVYHPPGDERSLWGAVSAAPIRSPEGKILGAVSTVTDVTALHDLQQENEIYVHTISHDLRTPLTVVMGHAELLETACPSEDSQVHVEAILKGAERMETMIENLVEAARLEGGNITLEKEPV